VCRFSISAAAYHLPMRAGSTYQERDLRQERLRACRLRSKWLHSLNAFAGKAGDGLAVHVGRELIAVAVECTSVSNGRGLTPCSASPAFTSPPWQNNRSTTIPEARGHTSATRIRPIQPGNSLMIARACGLTRDDTHLGLGPFPCGTCGHNVIAPQESWGDSGEHQSDTGRRWHAKWQHHWAGYWLQSTAEEE
jgi:hypothetical protein